MRLIKINLDPLAVVICFIICARAISHAVQINAAFNVEREQGGLEPRDAARIAIAKLFRPGMLGLAVDFGAMVVVAMTPIPLLKKAAIIGGIWIALMIICTVVMVPVILSWCTAHHEKRFIKWNVNPIMKWLLRWFGSLATSRRTATGIMVVALVTLAISGYYAKNITSATPIPARRSSGPTPSTTRMTLPSTRSSRAATGCSSSCPENRKMR
jgi:predicted RND superfamily exporter protein